jgi:hypothetical protein
MNLSKKFIGIFFFASGFLGGMLLGVWQMFNLNATPSYITLDVLFWAYSFIYIMLLASWYMLFDYVKQLKGGNKDGK